MGNKLYYVERTHRFFVFTDARVESYEDIPSKLRSDIERNSSGNTAVTCVKTQDTLKRAMADSGWSLDDVPWCFDRDGDPTLEQALKITKASVRAEELAARGILLGDWVCVHRDVDNADDEVVDRYGFVVNYHTQPGIEMLDVWMPDLKVTRLVHRGRVSLVDAGFKGGQPVALRTNDTVFGVVEGCDPLYVRVRWTSAIMPVGLEVTAVPYCDLRMGAPVKVDSVSTAS